MNQELFDNMQKQMAPSPEVRAALRERLARPAKRRPVPWMKYGAVAACGLLVIGAYAVHQAGKPRNMILYEKLPLHSYVTVEGSGEILKQENTTTLTGGGDTGDPNTGDLPSRDFAPSGALPGGAYIGDAPSQEEAVDAYQKLMDRFSGQYPDWYGGAYIDGSGYLVVQLVEDKDPGDKTLELQVLDWTDSGHVMFSSCKYSLRYLRDLQDKVVDAMSELDLFSSCGADEERNRLDLTLTSVTDGALVLLAELDPDDDAIYVQVGQRAAADVGGEDVRTDSAMTEDPAVHHAMPVPDVPVPEGGDGLIADEPHYDGARYDLEPLPQKLPAAADSVPGEDTSSSSPGTQ